MLTHQDTETSKFPGRRLVPAEPRIVAQSAPASELESQDIPAILKLVLSKLDDLALFQQQQGKMLVEQQEMLVEQQKMLEKQQRTLHFLTTAYAQQKTVSEAIAEDVASSNFAQ